MKITLASISLHNMAGGLERNIVRAANHLAAQGHDVSLMTFDIPAAVSFYPLDERVRWHKTGETLPHKKIGFSDRFRLLGRMRRVLRGQDYIVVFHHGILLRILLASLGLKAKVICSERSALSSYTYKRQGLWNLNFLMLTFVSRIVVQFERYKESYPFWLRGKITCIPNAVEPASETARPDVPNAAGRFQILAVGRLSGEKNYDCLIRAFAKLAPRFPLWDLVIVGDGAGEALLKQISADMNLEGRFLFPGKTDSIADFYRAAHIYCMPSKWEGFPNALAEAMAHGLPAAGFEECDGVRDLIVHGVTGFLAEGMSDENALSLALSNLIDNPKRRVSMGRAAVQSMERYRPEQIRPLWNKLLQK